jgi:hypothetical protein
MIGRIAIANPQTAEKVMISVSAWLHCVPLSERGS